MPPRQAGTRTVSDRKVRSLRDEYYGRPLPERATSFADDGPTWPSRQELVALLLEDRDARPAARDNSWAPAVVSSRGTARSQGRAVAFAERPLDASASRALDVIADGAYALGAVAAYPVDHPIKTVHVIRRLLVGIGVAALFFVGVAGLLGGLHPVYVAPPVTAATVGAAVGGGAPLASASSSSAPPGNAAPAAARASGAGNAGTPARAASAVGSRSTSGSHQGTKGGAASAAGTLGGRAAAAGQAVRTQAQVVQDPPQPARTILCSPASMAWENAQIGEAFHAFGSPLADPMMVATMVDLGCLRDIDPTVTAGLFMHEDGNINNRAVFPNHMNWLLFHTRNPGNIKCMYRPCYNGFQVYPSYWAGILDWYRLYEHYWYDLGIHNLASFVRTYCPGGVDGNGSPDQYRGDVNTKAGCIRGGWSASSCAAGL